MERIQVELAGHVKQFLICDEPHSRCGKIEDGICFWFSNGEHDYDGAWLMRFEDLERIYKTVAAEYKPATSNL